MTLAVALATEPIPRHPRGQPLANEFRGLGRAFRSPFIAGNERCNVVFASIAQPLADRANRHPVPRPEQLAQAVRRYRQEMPERGRLDLTLEHHRTRLSIRDVRVSVSSLRVAEWDDEEPGITLVVLHVEVGPRLWHLECRYLAYISLHALGRRCQRAFSLEDHAILTDLRALTAAHDTLTENPPGAEFSVPCPDGGAWVGRITTTTTQRSRTVRLPNVRTYLPDGETHE